MISNSPPVEEDAYLTRPAHDLVGSTEPSPPADVCLDSERRILFGLRSADRAPGRGQGR
jgi:hypothetical protein